MKTVDGKPSIHNDFNEENNKEGPKLNVGDNVRLSKHKCFFSKDHVPNWSKEPFVIERSKSLCRGHMLLVMLTEKKLFDLFKEKNYKKQMKKALALKK